MKVAAVLQYSFEELVATLDIMQLSDELRKLEAQKKSLEEQLKEINAQIELVDKTLSEQMIQEEMPRFTRNGLTFCLNTRTFASPREGQKEILFGWLKENGHGDMVKETVHAGTLSSFAKELKEENGGELPEELQSLVNVYEKTTVGMRKSK